MSLSVGAVLLTMGNRPEQFTKALKTLQVQRDVKLQIVLVGNGYEIPTRPGVSVINLPKNIGCPAGRNVGAASLTTDILFFYDDDAWLPDDRTLAKLVELMEHHPEVAAVQCRPVDPVGLPAPRRWQPRMVRCNHSPTGEGPAVWIWEGVSAVRRDVFEKVSGWPGHFFFGHEGIDLMWRIWEMGYVGWYAADLVVHHPATSAKRHELYFRTNARNRVWVALRNLPAPLVPVYLATWTVITLLRECRRPRGLLAWAAGFVEGLRGGWGERRPMSWRTVWRLTKAGHPPVI